MQSSWTWATVSVAKVAHSSITAICFGVLAVVYPILGLTAGKFGIDNWIITGYYGFFCLFFLGLVFKQRHIHEYCGFVNSVWIKSLFYIFCASLAFANFTIWICWLMGSIMAVGAILNFIRCIGGHKKSED